MAVAIWVKKCFGEEAMSPHERGRRFAEEAIELTQAVGVSREDALALVNYIYDREPGKPAQELGGVGVALLGLAEGLGLSADDAEAEELERIHSKPDDYWRGRQKTKADAGLSITYPREPEDG